MLEGEEHRHLVQVMRAKCGDQIVLFDGNGKVAECQIDQIGKKDTMLKVLSVRVLPKSEDRLVLAAVAIKGDSCKKQCFAKQPNLVQPTLFF